MPKVSFFTVCLSLCLAGLVMTSMGERQSPVFADDLDKELSVLQAELIRRTESKESMSSLKEATVLGAANFECTGGKNPAKMSLTDYIKAFSAGPCTPLIVLAGISGTKLKVGINCKILSSQRPDIMSACGWTSCSRSLTELLAHVPKEEYNLWVPELTSPFSLINPTAKAHSCMSALFGISWTKNNNLLVQSAVSGVTVRPVGYTESSRKDSRCGFDSISNILPLLDILTPHKYKMFNPLRASLEAKGYMPGINLQALPYDWRKTFYSNDITERFDRVLTDMYKINGKKVSLVAHSMGNMNILNVLKNLGQAKKDLMVQRYFALAPPYLGAPLTFNMLVGGSDQFYFAGFGINFWTFKRTVTTFPAIYDLMPRRVWSIYRNTPWLKSVINRISREQGRPITESITDADDIAKRLLPDHNAVCYGNPWTTKSNKCISGMEEMHTLGSINGEAANVDNIQDMLAKYSYEPNAALHFANEGRRGGYDALEHPGVQTVIMYSTINTGPRTYKYNSNPKSKAMEENVGFLKPDTVVESLGDRSVLTSSSLVAGFKWAHEFENKVANTKPIVFAEICSTYNQKNSVFQTSTSVNRNEYQGVKCSCGLGSEKNCDHVGIVSDQGVIDYISASLNDNQTPHTDRILHNISEEKLKLYADTCTLVYGI